MAARPHLTSIKGFDPGWVDALLTWALAGPGAPPVLGIAGLQGSGKSTLARQLVEAGTRRGLRVLALSLDDFYLKRRERRALSHSVHPLLATRGPPGTHDVALAIASLDALRLGQSTRLPRFDKLRDRRLPPSRWRAASGRWDLIVFEGWLLGLAPQDDGELRRPVNALEREEDPDGRWRRYCNRALAGYAPLWRRLDRLLFLQGPGFAVVPRWRGDQEHSLRAARPGAPAMTAAQLARFVQHFERLSRHALRTLPARADRSVRLDARRQPRD